LIAFVWDCFFAKNLREQWMVSQILFILLQRQKVGGLLLNWFGINKHFRPEVNLTNLLARTTMSIVGIHSCIGDVCWFALFFVRRALWEPSFGGICKKHKSSFFMYTHIHIGKIIRKTLREQGRSVKWFAGQLPCDRTTAYKLFKKESIDTALLQRISKILNENLFEYYCQNSKSGKNRYKNRATSAT